MIGVDHVGIGSDLCQDQPDSVVDWMRNGRWSKTSDYGEGSRSAAGFPSQPAWFRDNRDFPNLAIGLERAGFGIEEVGKILGLNWFRFWQDSFVGAPARMAGSASASG